MKTHTIRWNGSRAHKIVTFTPQYLKILKNSHRDAVSLMIMKLLKDLKDLTGIKHIIDYNVMTILEDHFDKKVIQCSISVNYVKKWFEQGYLNATLGDCGNDIEYLNLFYNTFFKGDNK
jgi:hypothetical protein